MLDFLTKLLINYKLILISEAVSATFPGKRDTRYKFEQKKHNINNMFESVIRFYGFTMEINAIRQFESQAKKEKKIV